MKIVRGKELKAGDNIVDRGIRVVIKECGLGKGAGVDEFGEYVWVVPEGGRETLWVFQESPIVLL